MRSIELKVLDSRLGTDFPMPSYATEGSAGIDLRACLDQPLVLHPGSTELAGTRAARARLLDELDRATAERASAGDPFQALETIELALRLAPDAPVAEPQQLSVFT